MPIFQFGYILRNRREELGYTQEDLADGICSVPTLSRIENGERMPTKEHFEMLIQRLGYSDAMLDIYVDEKQFILHDLKFRIRQAIILNALDKAQNMLSEYENSISKPTQIEKQFIILCKTLANTHDSSPNERLHILEGAIRLTCPKYDKCKFPQILSFEEIIILNNIAVCHAQVADYEQAVFLLRHLKKYYEDHVMNPEEYGSSECGTKWSLVRRKRKGDAEAALSSAHQALELALIMEKKEVIPLYQKFLENNMNYSY